MMDMMEWVLVLTLWTGETVLTVPASTQHACNTRVAEMIRLDAPDYGPPAFMNIYCEPLAPGEPIIEWWKLCSWRDGCWGPDTVNWSDLPPTRPGWYLHRYRVKDEFGSYDLAHPLKLDWRHGLLTIVDTGVTWRAKLPWFPVASAGGEWTQDALVVRTKDCSTC